MKKLIVLALTGLLSFTLLAACGRQENVVKIAATPVPHADLLEFVKEDLAGLGIELKIVEIDDYNLPNRLLYEGQVDANFFQHEPFLNEQNKRFNYDLVPLVAVHIEPLGLYSKKINELKEVKEGALIALPSDPTNEARALLLLQDVGLIKLKAPFKGLLTIYDIESNPKHLKLEEVDAAFLPRSLGDVDLAVIPANFALAAHLNPAEDALALESSDSPYANIIVVQRGRVSEENFEKLKKVLKSEKLRRYIEERYKGAILTA